ncbi:MAG TPA: PQQ-binding-like beta-propeller repeat protein [Bryobacteraceae bacterium]|jgi:PQQ-dependent dehydrogenase (methanol/ethanol family)|nr:PQQ-binding-like beta-propeller repeat protein [Bryobacteraceae bacterium]
MRAVVLIFTVAMAVAQVPAEKQFAQICAACHGEGGSGGDRAPALTNNRGLRSRTEAQIADIIKNGTPGGMPGFPLKPDDLAAMAGWVRSLNMSALDTKPEGDVAAGEKLFFGSAQCSTCHMVHGRGKVQGPDLSDIARKSTVRELGLVLDDPTSQMGIHTTPTCPNWAFCPDEAWAVVNVRLRRGGTLRGFARNRSEHDIQVQTFDGKMHLLTDDDYTQITREKESYMPPLKSTPEERRNILAYLGTLGGSPLGPLSVETDAPSKEAIHQAEVPAVGSWPSYDGLPRGNRYSALNQINAQTVKGLKLQWIYSLRGTGLQTTPVVSDGMMFVTAPGEVCAIDSGTGHEVWCTTRATPRPAAGGRGNAPAGNAGDGNGQPNRGVAILGDRIFFATGDAHLLCLNRLTGGIMWEIVMPITPGRYSSTAAPLVVGDLVVSGIAGGDGPLRGFLAAYKVATGELAWRLWTVPKPGEPLSETWSGKALETGGGATWTTGSYDAETGTLYWTVGNPFPATDGDEREGTNLYTNCVLALDAKTGKVRWYYQFTPHDLHDWDATEPLVLVDIKYQGRDRKLLLQANRNGFLYVLDRTNGELLLGKAFVNKMNWASGIGPDGKPMLLPANKPTKAGVKTCPAVRGATNWYATAFSPLTKLFYVMAVEDCSIYKQSQRGGYEGYRDPTDSGLKYLRAFDITTGKIAWEVPQVGPQEANYSGVLATGGGLVFFGETGGGFAAADAGTGKILWRFKSTQAWKASPMTYLVDGHQHVAVASGGNILSFSLDAN